MFFMFCPKKGNKKGISVDRYSIYAKHLAYFEECSDVSTMIQNSTHSLTTRTKFSTKVFLVFELVFYAILDFFHDFIGRVATIHNLVLLHIAEARLFVALIFYTIS